MTGTKKFKRVVTCQGGIQLVAAIAALETREAEQQRRDVEYEDYLVIYDLYAPDSQLPQFEKAVQRMARALRNWKSIVYFSKEQMVEFDKQLTFATRRECTSAFVISWASPKPMRFMSAATGSLGIP